MTAARSVTATFNASSSGGITLPTALDNNFTWTTGGSNGSASAWTGQSAITSDGVDAAQSATIGDGQTTWVQTTVTGPGTLSYYWKVSSEAGFDFLAFFYDGYEQTGAMAGEVNWQAQAWAIPTGTHTLSWSYSKDSSVSSGSDRAWLDRVTFIPGTLSPSAMPVSMSSTVRYPSASGK
jgi:hypothetical protein